MDKLQIPDCFDEIADRDNARLDALVANLQHSRTLPKTRIKRTYLPLGTRVYVRAEAVPVYHQNHRVVDRQKLDDSVTGTVVGVRFLAEGRHSAGDESYDDQPYLETWRTIPVYLVARTLFMKPMQVLLGDVMAITP